VEANFDAFIFQGCDHAVDAVRSPGGRDSVEEAGIYEVLGDTLLSDEALLALELIDVIKLQIIT
jgi:hypothetical protein